MQQDRPRRTGLGANMRNPDCNGPDDDNHADDCRRYARRREAEAVGADSVVQELERLTVRGKEAALDGETTLAGFEAWCDVARIETIGIARIARVWRITATTDETRDVESVGATLADAFHTLDRMVYDAWTAYAANRRELAADMLAEIGR